MYKVFFDEKGPQDTIRPASSKNGTFDDIYKIKTGDDKMLNYVGVAAFIDSSKYDDLSKDIEELELDYLKSRQNGANADVEKQELKGAMILRRNFRYGMASLKPREVKFYLRLFDILDKYKVDLSLYSVNKITILTMERLKKWIAWSTVDWIKKFGRFGNVPMPTNVLMPTMVGFNLVDFYAQDGSEKMIRLLSNTNVSVKEILKQTAIELRKFIKNDKGYKRQEEKVAMFNSIERFITFYLSNENYQKFVNYQKYEVEKLDDIKFNWNYIKRYIDKMLSSRNVPKNKCEFYLDENMNSQIVENGKVNIADSKDEVGIRIADYLATLLGKQIKILIEQFRYDHSNPGKFTYLDSEMFDLNEGQFNLIKIISKSLNSMDIDKKIMTDVYFKDTGALISYLNYISHYNNFDVFKNTDNHPEKENKYLNRLFKTRDYDIQKNMFDSFNEDKRNLDNYVMAVSNNLIPDLII